MAKLIIIISHLPILGTSCYSFMRYKTLDRELKIFSWFLFVSGIIQMASLVLFLFKLNNMPLLHLYVAAGLICLVLFYQAVLGKFISEKITWGITIVFLAFTLVNTLFIQNILTYNSYALTVESVIIIILSLFTFMLLLNDIFRESRTRLVKSLNWINSGLFIYYSSSLLIFYFGDLITSFSQSHLVKYTWVAHSFFSMIMYTCFFVGLWKRPMS